MPVRQSPGVISGSMVGRYRIEGELGRGGSATVYLARDSQSQRLVALKVLRPELAQSKTADRFAKEVFLTNNLEHPNILPVLDSGEHDGQLFCVLPHVTGGTLRSRLRNEAQLELDAAMAITQMLADALDFAHGKGIIHRDVKPENVLLSGDTAYLADFGIARALEVVLQSTTTSTGIVVGTPAYMSPEQAAGERNLDRRSDVYSLACVAYEMLSGMPAFAGPTPQSVIAQRLTHGPRPVHVYRPSLSASVQTVLEKALAPAPSDRYKTAGDFAVALRTAVGEVSAPAVRRRALRVPVAVAAVTVLAVVGWWVLGRTSPPLNANKIVVFPLVERGASTRGGNVGDEAALLIGNALEHTEPMKWIDGWASLDSGQRTNPALVSARRARDIARDRGARFYLQGSFIQRADSVTVVVEIIDVDADSVFARTSVSGRQDAAAVPLLGLRAVIQLLPRLVEPTRTADLDLLVQRRPAAVANFIQGEREYRRSHYRDALAYYRRAIEADSALVFAAIKGAQAANWANLNDEAQRLVLTALTRERELPDKYAQFAQGLRHFLQGEADSAVARFTLATELDPNWGEAWTALGETYFHLFPQGAAWDSVARVAFERARQEDRGFAPPIFHLIELASGTDAAAAARLFEAYQRFDPESTWVAQLEMTVECAGGRMDAAAWTRLARRRPEEAAKASKTLALIARNYECAENGFRAVLAADSASFLARWMATYGLQSLLIARGRVGDARTVVDSAVAGGMQQAKALYIVDAAAGFGMDDRAADAMKVVSGRYGSMPSYRLWYHTMWQAHRKNGDSLAAIDVALRAAASRGSASQEDRTFAAVAAAHLPLVRGDTATALRRLQDLRPSGAPAEMAWGFWESQAWERMALARLLLARREFAEAIRVADGFDHPQPVVHLIFLPASLVLRAQAARGLQNQQLEATFRERLRNLGQLQLLESALR